MKCKVDLKVDTNQAIKRLVKPGEEYFKMSMTVPPSESSLRMSDSVANFFKVILPSTIKSQKLNIPIKFVIEFGDELANGATLIVPAGGIWRVGLERAHKRICFVHNWQKFAEHYSLSAGQFLLFSYRGNSTFHVRIFDFSCCEIEYPCVGPSIKLEENVEGDVCGTLPSSSKGKGKFVDNKKRKSVAIAKKFEQAKSKVQRMSLCQDFPTRKNKHKDAAMVRCKKKSSKILGSGTLYFSRSIKAIMSTISKETKRAMKAAEALKISNPAFMVILRDYSISNGTVVMPAQFVRDHMNGFAKLINLKLASGNEQWPVHCTYDPRCCRTVRLQTGCPTFYKDNDLEDGDVCVFELLRSKAVELKVSIFHASDYASV
ncbi:B3 domain-containing transcription factor VRN1-like [Argentina anserina]|uniref:B3 domain-containing transcription factor VRN1-like n=1 Tax=Argentina anserina TaxID=57926 RepID=UPI0021766AFA|nr:B3 domain-containing transcription factor VRN1-like [Potentilla anserina]